MATASTERPISCGGRAFRAGAIVVAVATLMVGGCTDDPAGAPGESLVLSVSGGGQRGLALQPLTHPIRVEVTARNGRPVDGAQVYFEPGGSGSVEPGLAVTDRMGYAATRWMLGPQEEREQRLRIRVVTPHEELEAVVEAGVLRDDEADLIVVHGAVGRLRGVLLVRDIDDRLEIVHQQVTGDTLVYLIAVDHPSDIVVFSEGNPPLRAVAPWTAGVDTIHVFLQPPVRLKLHVQIFDGVFEERRAVVQDRLERTESIWNTVGMGLTFGEITWSDATGGPPLNVLVATACTQGSPGHVLRLFMVHSINDGSISGLGCTSGDMFLASYGDLNLNLLAHEIGHTFTLAHTVTGLMHPQAPGLGMTTGEIFRAHFDEVSVLNTITAGQPTPVRRNCRINHGAHCLPTHYHLADARPNE
jgi:hypothetical protein